MTWVVGMPIFFGYSIGISDICVTLIDPATGQKTTRDCLQKIYPVGRDVVLAFAGSVQIGLAMVDVMRQLLVCPEGHGWDPDEVAKWWPEDARNVFNLFDDATKAGGCHLMMLAAHPWQDNGLFPRSYAYVFRSPYFEAEPVKPNEVVGIGSGQGVDACKQVLERLANDEDHKAELILTEAGMPGNVGTVLVLELTKLLQQSQPKGVSSHLHLCLVRRGGYLMGTNDHDTFDARGRTEFRMPPVATSWNELQTLLAQSHATGIGSTC